MNDNSGGMPEKSATLDILAPEDKTKRTEVHQFFKTNCATIITETQKVDGKNYIRLSLQSKYSFTVDFSRVDGKNKRRQFTSVVLPEKFIEFSLLKTNTDCFEAISILARFLGRKPKSFGFAGNKVLNPYRKLNLS